ncbi:MAG: thymidylate synthase (FAD), partial [Actinobacteria bacterium]|nr:thymidylate synthase (FAD) [Actinomycetota bacterium]
MDPDVLFEKLGGAEADGLPAIQAETFQTDAGTPYLKHPGVVMLARPQVSLKGMRGFLEGYDPDLG